MFRRNVLTRPSLSLSVISSKGSLRDELEHEIANRARLEEEVASLNGQLDDMREQSEEVVDQWRGACMSVGP